MKIRDFASSLEKYLGKRGIPVPIQRNIDSYINMQREELQRYDAEDLGEMAFEVASYGYYLQDLINQQAAKAEKCRREIEKLVGHLVPDYCLGKFCSKEEKWLCAIADNEHALAFRLIEENSMIAVTRLSYLNARLESITKTLSDLQVTKRRPYAKI